MKVWEVKKEIDRLQDIREDMDSLQILLDSADRYDEIQERLKNNAGLSRTLRGLYEMG